MSYPNRDVETQRLKDLAMSTPFSMSDLRNLKKDFSLTDKGVECAVAEALSKGLHPAEVALTWLNVENMLRD